MKKSLLYLIVWLWFSVPATSQQLYINEIMASNGHALADSTGTFEDWFEIYNPNAFAVDIAGYYVTDNLSNKTKYQLVTGSNKTIIPANGYLVLWASEALDRGVTHVNFKLSADGEAVGLYRPNGASVTTVDEVTFGAQRTDVSWGRKPDGTSNWLFFATTDISPGASNNARTGYSTVMAPPTFSQIGGFYTTNFNLTLTSPDPSAIIYYTLDGSDPDPTNLNVNTFQYKNSYPELPWNPLGGFLTGSYQTQSYSVPIPVSDRTNDANKLSIKSSTFNFSPNYFPNTSQFKGTVVRAVAYKANALVSGITTQTYFVTPTGPARYTIPVVSIATNEKNYFDYTTGIYTAGKTFDDWRTANSGSFPDLCTVGNFSNEGPTWERPGNVEFFLNNSSIINQSVGLRIHGNCSVSEPRKSVRLYGDSDFAYPFFSNRPANQFYNRLILRNGGNDWTYSLITDVLMQRMVQHLKFDTQSNRPSVVFVNGEYWGVHSLYERYDKYYVNRNYGVGIDSVDMVSTRLNYIADEGTLDKYIDMVTYFINTTPVSYSYVNTLMDVDNFTDYQISEIYATNTDWPYNNQALWRKQTSQYLPNAPYGHDGRFRWMMKDMDYGLSAQNSYTHNTLEYATSSTAFYHDYTQMFRQLLDLPEYKSRFINRYADLLNTTFNPTRVVDLVNTVQQEYQPYMTEHFARWHNDTTYNDWLANVDHIKTFVQQRPTYARDHIRNKFGLTSNWNVTVDVSNTTQGYVKVNTIDILPTTIGVPATPYPWTGIYFQDNAIRIVAKAKPGYKFVSWNEGATVISTDTAYSYNPTSNRSFTALFDLDNSFNSNPVSYVLSNCDYRFEAWSASAPATTYPPNMQFVSMNQEDPTLMATFTKADTVKGAYNYSSSTRINGLSANGISFINTGGTNPGYVATALGGAVLALNTLGLPEAYVQWTGGTVTPNPRQYAIRLRYRLGDSGPFTDLLNGANQPVEYVRNATAGHSQVIGPVALPANLLNKPYVQLLWQYYSTGIGTSGARDQLRLDDIIITRGKCQSLASAPWNAASTWSCGRVPTLCDEVIIKTGHQVSLPIPNGMAKSIQLESNAKLIYTTPSASVRLQK